MSTPVIVGMVRVVNGLLEKINSHGEAHLVKPGAPLHQGDILTLLSGEAYIQFVNGFPQALSLDKPFNLDGISPALKFGALDLNEQLVKEALARGVDPSLILDVLGAPAAGYYALGSGGSSFILDPMYSFGLVSSGFGTSSLSGSTYTSGYDPSPMFYIQNNGDNGSAITNLPPDSSNIGTTPTPPPNRPIVTLAVDSGSSATDRITNDGLITVSAVTPGNAWEISTDGGASWTRGAGNSFVLPPNVDYHTNEVQVRQIDSKGNHSAPGMLNPVEVDTIGPVVTFNSYTTNDTTPVLTGTVDDPKAIILVRIDGNDYQAINNGDGTWTLANDTVNALIEESYPVTVTATDIAGNVGNGTGTLIVDTSAAITINTISVDDVLNAVEHENPVPITGTTTGIEDGQTVKVTLNGVDYFGVVNANSWTVTVPSDAAQLLVNGNNYTVTATATDQVGNVANATHNLGVDTTAVITINTISQDDVLNGLERNNPVTINGTTTGVENGQTVTVNLNGVDYQTTVTGNTWSVNVPASAAQALVNGNNYTVTANVTDQAGNPANATHILGVETTPPSVTITSSDNIFDYGIGNTITFNFSEPVSGFTMQDITLAGGVLTNLTQINSNQWTATFTADGTATVAIDVINQSYTDLTGNPGSAGTYTADSPPIAVDDTLTLNLSNATSGLNGTFYNYTPGVNGVILTSTAQAQAYANSGAPADAVFVSTVINYGIIAPDNNLGGYTGPNTGDHLANWLRADADSLIRNDTQNTTQAIVHLQGKVQLAAGDYNFRITGDDGYIVYIDGQMVAGFPNNQSPTQTTYNSFTVTGSGLHTLEIYYYDQGGQYVLQAEIQSIIGGVGQGYNYLGVADPLGNGTIVQNNSVLIDSSALILANDSDADHAQASLTIANVSGASVGTVTLDANGNVVLSNLPAGYSGTVTFNYQTVDPSGALSNTATVTVNVNLATPQPTITLDPITPDNVINSTEASGLVSVTGHAGGDAKAGDTVTLIVNGVTYTGIVAANLTFAISVNGADLAADTNVKASITTVNSGGNQGSGVQNETYSVDTSAGITINTISGDDVLNAVEHGVAVAINGTTTGVENGRIVTVTLNGDDYQAIVTANTWNINVPAAAAQALLNGTNYTVTANVSDQAGNTATATHNLGVDTSAAITINTISQDNVLNALEHNNPVTINGTTTGVEDGRTVTVTLNGIDYQTMVTGNTWSLNVPAAATQVLANGNYTVTANVSDQAGNAATATHNLGVDTTAVISINTIAGDNVITAAEAQQPVAVSGTTTGVEANQTVTVLLQSGANTLDTYTAQVDASGHWSINITPAQAQALNAGNYTISASVSDLAGNPASATHNFGVNAAPIANNISAQGNEDTPITVVLTGTDANGSVSSFTINNLPAHGTLYSNAAMTNPVAIGDTIAAGSNSASLYFKPDANWSGNVQFNYSVTDNLGDHSTTATATVNVIAVADTPNISVGVGSPPDTGLTKYIWSGNSLNLTTNGNGEAPANLELVINNAFQNNTVPYNTSTTVTAVTPNADVTIGTASLQTGLIYLTANTAYTFSGVGDDSIAVAVGNTFTTTATWGGTSGVFSGTFIPTTTGYYEINIYHNNSAGPGNYNVNLNGIPLSTTNFELYKDVTDITSSGVTLAPLDPGGFYAGFNLNQGNENTAIALSKITASLVDTDGSETLSVSISNAPVGSTFSDGVNTFTTSTANPNVDVSGWNLSALTVTPPLNYVGNFTLQITDTATETSNNSQASKSVSLPVQVYSTHDGITINSIAGDDVLNAAERSQPVVISGTSVGIQAGQTLTVIITSGSSIRYTYNTTVLADGTWAVTMPAANAQGLANGSYVVNASVSGQASTNHNLAVDVTAPNAPAITSLTTATDSGVSSSDRITNINKPTLVGTAEANSIVKVYEGTTLLGTATTNSSGNWSLALTTALTDGTHSITATSSDLAGNTSATSTALSVVIDTVAPVPTVSGITAATDSGISSTDNNTNNNRPTLVGTAEANSIVKVYDGATLLGTVTANSSGNWSLALTTALTNGTHSITATASDTAGNVSTASPAVPLVIDTVAPTIPVVTGLTVATDTGVSNTDEITNLNKPTLTGTAEANSTVRVFDGAILLGTVTADGSGNWSLPISTALANGTHAITATSSDTAGNVSAASPALPLVIDTTAPNTPAVTSLTAATDSGVSTTDEITNVNKPTLVGTAEANSTVNVYDGATLLGTVTANGSGSWTLALTTALTDGAHSITATSIDTAGNVSVASPVLPLVIDTNAPNTPVVTGLTAATDSGVSTTDSNTNINKPTLVGTAEANSSVKVYDGATLLGTVTANGSGSWSLTLTTALTNGTHSITATSTDTAGNVSAASPALPLVIDTTAPNTPVVTGLTAVTDSGVSNTDEITNVNKPTLTGTAEANSTVKVFDGATLLGTVTADGSGNWSLPLTTALTDGTHSITATSTDTAGNVSVASPALPLVIDTLISTPSVSGLTAASDSGVSNTDNNTNINKPTLVGTAEANSTVNVYDGATLLGTVTANGSGSWSLALTTALTNGTHSITATSTDTAGNISASSPALPLLIDTTAPNTPVVSGLTAATDSGVSNTDEITNINNPTLTGTAEANSTVKVYDGATLLGTVTADGSGNWSLPLTTALANGAHAITATSTDTAGNVSAVSSSLPLIVDTLAPNTPVVTGLTAATDSGVSSTDEITNVNKPTLVGTAEANSTVNVYDGATLLGTVTADGSGNWSLLLTNALTDGTHSITATASDTAGNISAASSALPLVIDTVISTPTVSGISAATDSGVSNSDNITNINKPTLTGTAEANSTVKVFDGATLLGTVIADSSGNWSLIPTTALVLGTHSITAQASDAAGNASAVSPNLNLVIDTGAPTAPVINGLTTATDSGISSTDNTTNINNPTLTGTAEGNSTVKVYEGTTLLGTVTTDSSGNWSLPLTTALTDGTHSITATATDLAGNVSPASSALPLLIDTVISTPTVSGITVATDSGVSNTDSNTNINNPTLIGTAEANSTVKVYDGATLLGTVTTNSSGNWSLPLTTALSNAAHSITAVASDAAGNVSAASPALPLIIDTTAPNNPIISGLTAATDSGVSNTDNLTNVNKPTLAGTAEANSTVKVYEFNVLVGTATADSNGNWTFPIPTALTSGTHNFTATATDPAGNVSSVSPALSVSVDTLAPAVVTSSNNTSLSNGQSAVVTFSFNEPVYNFSLSDVAVTGGTLSNLVAGIGNTWTATFTSNNTGPITINVINSSYNDNAGNPGTAGNTLSINNVPIAQNDAVTINLANVVTKAGLDGNFYNYAPGGANAALTNVYQAENYINSGVTANAQFQSTAVKYGTPAVSNNLGGYSVSGTTINDNLKTFLGTDGTNSSYVRSNTLNTSQGIIEMHGLVQLAQGTYNIQVTADDGYAILIDGVVRAAYALNQSPATATYTFSIAQSGLHNIQIYYYDQGGQYVLQAQLQSVVGGVGQGYLALGVPDANGNGALSQNDAFVINKATLFGNDTDANDPNSSFTIGSVSGASIGTVSLDSSGNVVINNLPAGYNGTVTFTYQTLDHAGGALSNPATVTVNVDLDAPNLVFNAASNFGGIMFENLGGALNTAGVMSAGSIESALGLATGALSTFNPAGSQAGTVVATNGNYASNTYYISGGETMSLGYTFNNAENAGNVVAGSNDLLMLVVRDSHGNVLTGYPALITSSEQLSGAATGTGTYSFMAPSTGAYEFNWVVVNGKVGDSDNRRNSSVTLTTAGAAHPDVAVVDLKITAGITDNISGTDTLGITIAGVPVGAYLSAGTSVTSGNTTTWTLTSDQLHDLQFIGGVAGSYNLTVTATATDSHGNTSVMNQAVNVQIDNVTSANAYGGTSGNNSMSQTDAVNHYYAGNDGNDTIVASTGNNLIFGGAGNDAISGFRNSVVHGGDGNDTITAVSGNNTLYGDAGTDTLNAGTGNDILFGGLGSDTLRGGVGNNILEGGQGNDTMTGGGGLDTFVWMQGDNTGGSVVNGINTATDTITDFKANPVGSSTTASILNLSDLLSDDGVNNSLDNYLSVSASGGNTTIKVDPTGNADFTTPTQTIILSGVDLTAVFSTTSSHAIVDHLIANGNLITHH